LVPFFFPFSRKKKLHVWSTQNPAPRKQTRTVLQLYEREREREQTSKQLGRKQTNNLVGNK
jgi:hypothetical protein